MTLKVLIADDETDVLQSTAMLIQTMGLQVVPVGEATQILDSVAREKPDVILQDLRMPGLDVASLVAALRSNPATAEIPLVFFSASADLATAAARYDVWGYLTKPFEPTELAHLLQQIMGANKKAPEPISDRDFRQEIQQVFHDYWNLLSAEANYLAILKSAPGLIPDAKQAVHGLDELLVKLETRTDRLRSYILSLAGAPAGEADAKRRGASDSPNGPAATR